MARIPILKTNCVMLINNCIGNVGTDNISAWTHLLHLTCDSLKAIRFLNGL